MSSPSGRVTTIDLLRHGACKGGDIYRGRTDVVLSSAGWHQMQQAIDNAGGWQRVVSSPLLRCRAFAEQCATQLSIPLKIVTDLQEVDFGEWEGRLQQEVWRSDADLVNRFYEDPAAVTPPGGEATVAALSRVVEAWTLLLRECAGEHLLLVCHGGVIRLLLSHLLGMPLSAITRLHIPYAAIASIKVHHSESGDFPVLMSLSVRGQQA
jgi:alpha-ribazole phosphatase